jgi:hypothetical protein
MINPEDFGAKLITTETDPSQFGAVQDVNEVTGAPLRVRGAVGASKTPEDKLATLKSYYPDAAQWGEENFIYTDPETSQKTLYNPKGLDYGDISEEARMVFEFFGGGAGAVGAVIAGQAGPQLLAPEEIMTVPLATGLGAAAGGQAYDAISNLFFPHVDTRSYLERTAGMGADVIVNAIGARAGELVERGLKRGLSKGAQLARASSDEIYRAFRRMGVRPTAGAVSGSRTIQGVEEALSKLPASADIIGKEYAQLLDDMGQYAQNLARGVSPIEGKEATGVAIRRGINSFVTRFRNQADELYQAVDDFIPGETAVQPTNFTREVNDIVNQFADSPEFADVLTTPLMRRLSTAAAAAAERGGMSYSTLRALRTRIGQAINQPGLIPDVSQSELRRIYGALSDDVMRSAAEVGEPALRAARRANAYWAAGRARIDDVLTPVVNKDINHKIFEAAMSGAKGSSQKLRALKRSMPANEWRGVVAQQIREMGLATPGRQDVTGELFSPATFFNNYNNLSAAAQRTLFSGPQYRGLELAVNDLFKVSAALKDVSKMANTSGTAQQLMYMQMLTGGLGGLYGVERGESPTSGALTGMAMGVVAPWAAAKLISSPRFVNWLADAGRIYVGRVGIGQHLGRLAAMAEKDKELEPAIYEYMRAIDVGQNNVK